MQPLKHFDAGVFLALIVTAFLAAVAAHAGDDDGEERGAPFRAWPGIGVGAKTSGSHTGALGMTQLSFSLPLLDAVEPEVAVGFGVMAGDVTDRGAEVVNRFSFGLRWFVPVDGGGAFDVDSPVRPFLWTALHHGHKVSVHDTIRSPIGALLTSTDAGVGHLTGAEGGLGVLLALPIDGVSYPLLLRAGASWLPSFVSHHPDGSSLDDVLVVVDVAVGLPILFDK